MCRIPKEQWERMRAVMIAGAVRGGLTMAEKSLDDWIELLADRSKIGAIGEYFHREQCGELLKFLNELKLTMAENELKLTMAENELKSCPFCGGKAEIGSEYNDPFECGAIYCVDCGAKIEFGCGVELRLKAIEAWNRREPNDERR